MSKFMDPQEFEEWAAKPGRTIEEIEAKAIELQGAVRDVTLEAAGVDLEDFQRAPRDARAMIEDEAAEIMEHNQNFDVAVERASDEEEQAEVQTELANRHPEHFPSETNGNIFAEAYSQIWEEEHPGIPPFWEINAMETLYEALVAQHAFPVTRVFQS